jgi:ATP-binding cassette subfamily C protein LapB
METSCQRPAIADPISSKSKERTRIRIAPQARAANRSEWNLPREPKDPLAASVAECLRLRGHDLGVEALLSGVPLGADGQLTPHLAVQALERLGYRAQLTRSPLDTISQGVLPAVLFLGGLDACVLQTLEAERATVFWPAKSSAPIEIDVSELKDAYFGTALVLRVDQPAAQKNSYTRARHWYWGTTRKFWPEYLQVALAAMLINLLGLASPIFTMNVYDRVFPTASLITLWSLVAAVAIALIFDALLKWMRAAIVDNVSRNVDLSVSSAIFQHVSNLHLQDGAKSTGRLVNTLKDYEQVRDFFSSQTLATLVDLVFSVFFIAVIAYLGGMLAAPPAIALVLILLLGLAILFPLRNASNASRQMSGVKNAVAVEAISELETLKAISGQGRMQSRWEQQVADSARVYERGKKLATFTTTFTSFAQQMSSVGIVIIGVYLALEGSITMGAVIAAMILSGRALAPTAALSSLFVRGSFAFSTLRSLNQVMSMGSDSAPQPHALSTRLERGEVVFSDVGLTYSGAALPALQDITFTLKGGEALGVVGPVGAGKSSLVRLMSGLYLPTDGLLTVDGLNIAQIHPANLRRDVQLVAQDAVLFSGTLAENIAFGVPQAKVEDVVRIARLTGVDKLASDHPMGFSMPIEERGANLSGGQRQLIALARALLCEPKVLLLDEPTSSMDTATEAFFIERLRNILRLRPMTLVVSTHRLSLLELVDTVLVMESGKVKLLDRRDQAISALSRGQNVQG